MPQNRGQIDPAWAVANFIVVAMIAVVAILLFSALSGTTPIADSLAGIVDNPRRAVTAGLLLMTGGAGMLIIAIVVSLRAER